MKRTVCFRGFLLLVFLWACSSSPGSGPDTGADTGLERSIQVDVPEEIGPEAGDLLADELGVSRMEITDTAVPPDVAETPDFADAPELAELSVLTFNLHCHHDEPEKRFAMVVETAVEWGVRVLALQEVCEGGDLENTAKTVAGLLDDATGKEHSVLFSPTHVAWDTYQEGLGLVFAGQMIHSEAHDLPPGLFPRKALWARILDEGETIDIVVTHLSFGNDQAEIRIQQAEALHGFLVEKILPDAPGPVILAGDFNSLQTSQPVGLFTADGWTEAFLDLHPGDPGYTYPAGSAKAKIDHLLLLDGSYETILEAAVVLNVPDNGLYPSDHYGIAAILEF